MDQDILLEVKDLKTYFYTPKNIVKAVDGLDMSVKRGEVAAVVGESGSGKTIAALSVLRLVSEPPGKITAEKMMFEGRDLMKMNQKELRAVRGAGISMVFQEPAMALNPLFKIGAQISETIRAHDKSIGRRKAKDKAIELLDAVKIPHPAERYNGYPHQLSGGMKQRVMIAMALSCSPSLIIADEPTTALDVTVQRGILELLRDIKEKNRLSMIFITHDLAVASNIADYIMIMYQGRVVEEGSAFQIFTKPAHNYTKSLLDLAHKLSG